MAVNKTVDVSAKLLDKYKIEMKARSHTAYIDQPPAMGGEDAAPTPLEYLFFALAGCICTIGKIVAAQERIELRGIECSVEGGLNTAVLMGKTEEDRAGFQNLKVVTKIDADMTKEEKEAFLKKVDARCPISDNIFNGTPIEFVVE